MTTPTAFRPVVLGLVAVLLLGACGSATAPSSSPGPVDNSPSAGAPSSGSGDGSGGSSSPGDVGPTDPNTSVGGPVLPAPSDPAVGQAPLVIPKPGRLDPRPVGAALLEPNVSGHHVLVRVTWWSGVEPCSVLDSVKVTRSGKHITIQLIEGSSDVNAVCMEMATQKTTIVDLGDLDPGIWTISAGGGGDATPVSVTVT